MVNTVNAPCSSATRTARLTAKEFDLLNLFITSQGACSAREEMLDAVWKSDYAEDQGGRWTCHPPLREKVERNPAAGVHLHQVG